MKPPSESHLATTSELLKSIGDRAKKMNTAEFRESLVRAGIITRDGELTEHYKSKPAMLKDFADSLNKTTSR